MCVSNAPADFARTKLYAGRAGQEQVLIYSNTVRNRAFGPNAMLLHFPAHPGTMSQRSVLPTDGCDRIMDDMIATLIPREFGTFGLTRGGTRSSVLVFDTGVYTVVLADDARAIPAALGRVPDRKRPAVNQPLFDWYAETFPAWPVALCCFDNRDAVNATPMMWRYRPRNPGVLFYPAVDCHTGQVPELECEVDVDHWLLTNSPGPTAPLIEYRDNIPAQTQRYLPEAVIGQHVDGRKINGDFVFAENTFRRVVPHTLVSMIG